MRTYGRQNGAGTVEFRDNNGPWALVRSSRKLGGEEGLKKTRLGDNANSEEGRNARSDCESGSHAELRLQLASCSQPAHRFWPAAGGCPGSAAS